MWVRNPIRVAVLIALLAVPMAAGRAELLPIREYTAADGLPSYAVYGVEADSRGFVWLSMADGISRFDGYGFTTYTTADGLPGRAVEDFLETRSGDYYVATLGGLARFDPSGVPGTDRLPFVRISLGGDPHANEVLGIAETWDGALVCCTVGGLYSLRAGDVATRVDVGVGGHVLSAYEDGHGDLWIGLYGQVRRLRRDGRIEISKMPPSFPGAGIERISEDAAGRLWACSRGDGTAIASGGASADAPVVFDTVVSEKEYGWVTGYLRGSDGTEWITAIRGLFRLAPGAGTPVLERVPAISAVCARQLWGVADDHDGNLWIAATCGAMRVDWRGFTGYTPADGLGSIAVNSIFESRSGDLIVTALDNGRIVERFDGRGFVATKPTMPEGVVDQGWGSCQTVFQARDGAWWVPTGHGALRYPSGDLPDTALRGRAEIVMRGAQAFRMFEDSRGDVWIATIGVPEKLVRWERATGDVVDLTEAVGPLEADDLFTVFCETRDGAVWAGTGKGELMRYSGGRFERIETAVGAPLGWLRWMYVDDAGRLWIAASQGGLLRVDAPGAERLTFARYTMAEGLASDNVYCVTTDAHGRVYVGLPRGVDRLDPATGRVKHFTAGDGLPTGAIQITYRDRQGRVWFGSGFGLARLDPAPDRDRAPPRAVVTGLRVAGVGRPVSALGETSVGTLDLGPSENSVSVDFLGIGTSLGEELRYQYKLEGADDDWSAPTDVRTVTLASLGSGSYRLLVRAVDAEGTAGPEPAAVAFTIAAPVWRRWWFLALSAALVAGAAYALYRNRVAKLLAVERVRTRIASDLHDDIGANLTKIAVLSEVANYRLGREAGDESLAAIADISRESVAAMNDIVWAVNPGRDGVRDLGRRMRQFANDAFAASDVEVRFTAPETDEAKLDDELRRHVYLVFKEAVNNAVRHSGCSEVEVSLAIDRRELILKVADDGRGFDTSAEAEGNGLANMRKRALAVGATLDVRSSRERGTAIMLSVSLGRGPRSHVRDGERRSP